jgi:diguanylate cyclase (GGDEF)-like protein
MSCDIASCSALRHEPDPVADGLARARAEQARAHESVAEVLAGRGDHQRAYHHLKAALALVRADASHPVAVPEPLRHAVERLRRERAEAREQSRRDSVTATYNRRYLDERLATLRHEHGGRACVALADVDHFKHVNDGHGHSVGDEVLRRLVTLVTEQLPDDAFCARYGGEEFALVLPALACEQAVEVCEAARARVDGYQWGEVAPGLRVTISLGVACVDPSEDGPDTSLDAADGLLYVAKRAGRNAVAFRSPADQRVHLAGPSGHRRGIDAAVRSLFLTS